MKMDRSTLGTFTVAAAVVVSSLARAASIQYIPNTLLTDLSSDGSVAVGNIPGSFETFRWTQGDGVVPLGRGTVEPLGVGAGSPDVSYDGTKISATILSDSGTQALQGQWTLGEGWKQLSLPPAGSVPMSLGDTASAWGQSGDGSTVVGSFWVANSRARATRWTSATGAVDLGAPPNQSSRASAANFDGSVVGGWEAAPGGFPNRNPTVWVNGVKTVLGTGTVNSEVYSVNANGTVVGGSWRDAADPVRGAAIWRYDGSTWNLQKLGVLPGTQPETAGALVDDLSADGSIAVGFNRFGSLTANDATGFYWSQVTGMISANQLFTNLGLTVPPGFQILELSSVSPDGSAIGGIGLDFNSGGGYQSFIITVPEPGSFALTGLLLPVLARRRSRRTPR